MCLAIIDGERGGWSGGEGGVGTLDATEWSVFTRAAVAGLTSGAGGRRARMLTGGKVTTAMVGDKDGDPVKRGWSCMPGVDRLN